MSTSTESVDLVGDQTVENIARTALFAALMGAFAYVSFPVPVSPTPVTLQVLGVFLAGIMLGPTWGAAAMVLYLAAGAVGVPVFANGSAGVGVLLSYTAGYLLSYPLAAFAIGAVAHGGLELGDLDAGVPRLLAAMALGTVVIYALGVGGMLLVLDMSPTTAVVQGALVFLPAEVLKAAAAVGIVRSDAIAAR